MKSRRKTRDALRAVLRISLLVMSVAILLKAFVARRQAHDDARLGETAVSRADNTAKYFGNVALATSKPISAENLLTEVKLEFSVLTPRVEAIDYSSSAAALRFARYELPPRSFESVDAFSDALSLLPASETRDANDAAPEPLAVSPTSPEEKATPLSNDAEGRRPQPPYNLVSFEEAQNREFDLAYSSMLDRSRDAVFSVTTACLPDKTIGSSDATRLEKFFWDKESGVWLERGAGVFMRVRGLPCVFTNDHVVRGAKATKDVVVETPDRRKTTPLTIYRRPCIDFALLVLSEDAAFNDVNSTLWTRATEAFERSSRAFVKTSHASSNEEGFLPAAASDLKKTCGELSVDLNLLPYLNVIEFKSRVAPGDSGSALLDLDGLVGLVFAKRREGDVCYALPLDLLRQAAEYLIDTRGRWQPFELDAKFDDGADGVVVSRGGSGLLTGDVVIAYNGDASFVNANELTSLIAFAEPGKEFALRIRRGGVETTKTFWRPIP